MFRHFWIKILKRNHNFAVFLLIGVLKYTGRVEKYFFEYSNFNAKPRLKRCFKCIEIEKSYAQIVVYLKFLILIKKGPKIVDRKVGRSVDNFFAF